MKFFNLYQNRFKHVVKCSRVKLYQKYYYLRKTKYIDENNGVNNISDQFINDIVTIKKKKNRKKYYHNYYMKIRRKKNKLRRLTKCTREKENSRKLYTYHMTKDKVFNEKKKKKKQSLTLEWDYQNPCEK